MRSFLAGLLLLIFLSAAATAQQVSGFVESIGVQEKIRPDCWTPLRVNLTSTDPAPHTYQLQVWQEDLDKDHVVYTKEITLNPSAGGQKFEMYFVLQPLNEKEKWLATITTRELQKTLRVRLCVAPEKNERKKPDELTPVIDRLPITNLKADNIDPPETANHEPGRRLLIYVTDSSSNPIFYHGDIVGLVERVEAVEAHPADLGENVLYYDAVDTVVWLSGNADDLSAAGSHRLEALQQFVRKGGRLVVCQTLDLQKTVALAPMLPVITPVETRDAEGKPFQMARFTDKAPDGPDAPPIDALPLLAQDLGKHAYKSNWHRIDNTDGKHPIRIAHAAPKPDAVVELWQNWPKESKRVRWPYIVRGAYGLGCVTWVAQDLGDPTLTVRFRRAISLKKPPRSETGPARPGPDEPPLIVSDGLPDADNWPHVWDHIIGWHNDTVTRTDVGIENTKGIESENDFRRADGAVDFGRWMLKGTDFGNRGAAYISLAVLFFILYWVVAGPGTYFFLRNKKRKDLNWFLFGTWAFVGTALTILMVRLVLRGAPDVRHLTIVRQVAGEPARVFSRVGLYIPQDGDQAIGLEGTSPDALSYITPLQIHSDYADPTDFPAAQQYSIPVHDDSQDVVVHIPFRSTVKKLQMEWAGKLDASIGGSPKLIPLKDDAGVIAGMLFNRTGSDLKNIYFAFTYTDRRERHSDIVLYVCKWNNGTALDLNTAYTSAKLIDDPLSNRDGSNNSYAIPQDRGNTSNIRGAMEGKWDRYWSHLWRAGTYGSDAHGEDDFNSDVPSAFPILSLYDRITPARNEPDKYHRLDILRRGGRVLNMSSAVAAGRLVVLAQSTTDDKPVPFPLTVEGRRVSGQGRIFYQFALPLDRTEMDADAVKSQ
jgi:hypothetical protein